MKKILVLSLILFCACKFVNGQHNLSQKDLTVLKEQADSMMKNYLTNIVDRQFDVRDSLLSTLKSKKDWDNRSEVIRDSMISWTGPFPERTPLNAQLTGRLEKDDYVIEKILFESRPNFFVSANLYLPKNISYPRPALLNVIGHGPLGKADERYQRLSIAQVKNGFVVLTIDCIGQGERKINDYASWQSPPSNAHKIIGIQAFISGTHVFNLMVWDAIRAIDYLVARPEVDVEKICITGSSGGGMMSTYILPFDDRILVSVPTCNPNTWSYRVRANLSTDHEQVFFGAFESSIDPRGDPLFTHVPKPLLLNTTTDDQLNPPRGVWDLNTWLYKSYSAHGVPEKYAVTMVKAPHAYNQEQREVTYSWMLRWTGGNVESFWEEDFPIEKEENLFAAPGGSVFNVPASREPHELVLDYLDNHKAIWKPITTVNAVRDHNIKISSLITKVLNTNFDNLTAKCDLQETKSVGNINIRSFIIKPEPGIVLPGIILESNSISSNEGVVLYINEKGKVSLLDDMDIVTEILSKGYRICAVDIRGIGETSPDMSDKLWDFLAGKPIFGQRVKDILTVIKWLKESETGGENIKLWGTGMCSLYGAFAGVLSNDISGFIFEESLISFESVVRVKMPGYRNNEVMLPNLLQMFDMPQVYQALCPRPLTLINPLLGDKTIATDSEVELLNDLVSATYRGSQKKKNWGVQRVSGDERQKVILNGL